MLRRSQRARQFKHKHGLKLADLHEMWVQQGGACRICRMPYPDPSTNGSKDGLVVDHCHRSRTIRSLLCQACNRMRRASRDNPDILAAGAAYLQEHIGGPVDQG